MYTVMGATGKVGASVARHLLAHGDAVWVPVRDAAKAQGLAARGARLVEADYANVDGLAAALRRGRDGAFVMLPPVFDPSPGFPEALSRIEVLYRALDMARPAKVVALSTIGADAVRPNLLRQLQFLEQRLGALSLPVTLLRAAWFIDNAAVDVDAARTRGEIDSYLQPLERAIPMVAAADVGATAAELLKESWEGLRVVEVEGPERVSPLALAMAFASALGRPVHARAVARSTWASIFAAQGMRNPEPRMQMLDGFNEGWIRFADDGAGARRGSAGLERVVGQLVRAPG